MQKRTVINLLGMVVMCFIIAILSEAQVSVGEIVEHKLSDENAYTFYTYIPSTIKKQNVNDLLVLCHGGTWPIGDYGAAEHEAHQWVFFHRSHAETYRFLLLCTALPRDDWLYSQVLNKECFTTNNEFHKRPDLKLIDIINQYKGDLENSGYKLDDKIMIAGVSSGGAFAPRFASLHPEMVRAVGAGNQGGLILPLTDYEGDPLTYPVGVCDLEELTGSAFNLEVLKGVSFRTFIGAEDLNPENDLVNFENYTQEQINQINQYFGTNPPARAENFHNTLVSLGIDSEFQAYPGVGHNYTEQMKYDLFDFLNAHKNSSGSGNGDDDDDGDDGDGGGGRRNSTCEY